MEKKVIECCPHCGKILKKFEDMHYPGVHLFVCRRCNTEYRQDSEKYAFVPFNSERKYVLRDGTEVDLSGEFRADSNIS